MEIFPLLASYALLGVFAGVIAGLLGVGGGLIVVPILAALYSLQGFAAELTMQLAVGTSLATIVFTSLSSMRAHHRRGAVDWPIMTQLSAGILLGAWLGGVLAQWLGGVLLALLFGLGRRLGAAVALLLAQSGEFGLVLFAYAFQEKLLAADVFQQLLVIIVLSMLVTPVLANIAHRLAARRARMTDDAHEPPAKAPVVLAGYGRVGRRIGSILESANVSYVAIDIDSSLVLRERANGHSVFYGDGRRPDVLRSAGVADAQLVVVTLDDFEAAETVVSTLHGEYPDIAILARGHSARQCRRMLSLGAKFAVAENLEASLDLAREVLMKESGDLGRTNALLESFRREYYEHIDTEADDEARDSKSQA
mgnify:CR=1 FL=1